jgi:hypothetical protein
MGIRSFLLAGAASLCFAVASQAAVSYTTPGSTYSQNFDSLPNTPTHTSLGNSPTGWTDDNPSPGAGNFSIVGWYLWHDIAQAEGGFNSHQRMRIGNGGANTGSFWSYGTHGSTERALGDLGSNTIATVATGTAPGIYIGVLVSNDTGGALQNIQVGYTGEQWRDGGNNPATLPQGMTFAYKVNAANLQDTGFTPQSNLDFTGPINVAGGAVTLDGNAAPNRQVFAPTTLTGLTLAPGDQLWIRWFDENHASNDHGLAIDDFSFTAEAVPEPASLALLGILGAGLMSRRRA